MSNRRKLKRPPLPRCADCDSRTYTGTAPGGGPLIHVDHDPDCPAWHGITPNPVHAWLADEVAAGSIVVYLRKAS